MEFELPDNSIFKPHHKELPMGWDHIPALKASIEYGSNLLKSGILGFMVPSVVDPSSMNFVINPSSQDFKFIKYKTYPFQLDKRIIR
jgi:RES domain-containing protein